MGKLEMTVLDLVCDALERRRSTAVTLEDLNAGADWLTRKQVMWGLLALADRGLISYISPLGDGSAAIIGRPLAPVATGAA